MIRKSWIAPMAIAVALFAASCSDSGNGNLFELDGKIFVFNYRVATATYLINIKPTRPSADDKVAVVSFENPAGGDAIVVSEKIWPNTNKTTIHSPPLNCIVKNRPYKVAIRIQDAEGKLLQQIDTTVTSSQDQTDLPEKPLVVGPFYDPNPEAGTPDSNKPACPSA
jgi:hypothetical protein